MDRWHGACVGAEAGSNTVADPLVKNDEMTVTAINRLEASRNARKLLPKE